MSRKPLRRWFSVHLALMWASAAFAIAATGGELPYFAAAWCAVIAGQTQGYLVGLNNYESRVPAGWPW